MKRMNFWSMGALVLLLTFTACNDEIAEVQSSELKQIVMTASDFESEDGSRTNFLITASGAEFSWAANDTVGIFPNEGAQAFFPMVSGAGTKSANFTGGGWALKDASTYGAYYPFIGSFYLDKNAIPVDYTGQVQTGDASTAHLGAYDYMAAIPATPVNGNVTFSFKHLGALVQLKLTVPQPTTLTSVALATENNSFAVKGKVDIMANTKTIESTKSAKELTLDLKNITTTEPNQVVTFYMMIPPVDLSTKVLKAMVKTNSGSEEVILNSKNFQAGKIYAVSGSMEDKEAAGIDGGTVTITTAGTLKSLLGDNYLKIGSLKVVGPINGDDIYYLRKMLGAESFNEADWGKLATLDLSEATIVEGGEWYLSTGYNKYYTKDNVIGTYMFLDCSNLQNIILPNNVISIEENVFSGCYAMKSVLLGDKIVSIGYGAFSNCGIVSITIPNSVNSMGDCAFSQCSSLTSATIGDGVTVIQKYAFRGCGSLKSVTIGNSVTAIGYYAFDNCYSLPSIEIPDCVLLVGDYAFSSCSSLTSVTIGDGVTSIGAFAFEDCSSLTSVFLGENIGTIGISAFSGATSLNSINITNLSTLCNIDFRNASANPLCYGGKLYLQNEELTKLIIPEDIKEVKKFAFYGCKSLKEVIITENVISIGEYAFRNCGTFEILEIGKNITSIGLHALYDTSVINCFCYATTPPNIIWNYNAWNDYQSSFGHTPGGKVERTNLYVPERCNIIYEGSYWSNYFENIIEME